MKQGYLDIIFEDDDYLILNKPAGLLTIPDRFRENIPNLYAILRNKYKNIFVVHRLDADTSGVIVFAKNSYAHRDLSIKFEKRNVKKIYLALINGRLDKSEAKINLPVAKRLNKPGTMKIYKYNGKKALTHYRVVESFRHFTLVEVELLTGRMHQIRVHFQAIGHPLAVDEVYGVRTALYLSEFKTKYLRKEDEVEKPLINRLTLHAKYIEFKHYKTGNLVQVEAPLPKDFNAVLNQLRKNDKS